MNLLRPLNQLLLRWRHVSDAYQTTRDKVPGYNTFYRHCCGILKYSKTVPTFLEIALLPRNGKASKVTEQTIHVNVAMVWSDPFIREAKQKN
jgi:hypothetical protein